MHQHQRCRGRTIPLQVFVEEACPDYSMCVWESITAAIWRRGPQVLVVAARLDLVTARIGKSNST